MTEQECSSFQKCATPICPRDPESKDCIWFPTEDVCGVGGLVSKNQRKIQQRTKDATKCFTYAMLDRKINIKSGIIGIDAEKVIDVEEARWLRKHPARRELSDVEKEARKAAFLKNVKKR